MLSTLFSFSQCTTFSRNQGIFSETKELSSSFGFWANQCGLMELCFPRVRPGCQQDNSKTTQLSSYLHKTWMENGSRPRIVPLTVGVEPDKRKDLFFFFFLIFIHLGGWYLEYNLMFILPKVFFHSTMRFWFYLPCFVVLVDDCYRSGELEWLVVNFK